MDECSDESSPYSSFVDVVNGFGQFVIVSSSLILFPKVPGPSETVVKLPQSVVRLPKAVLSPAMSEANG